MPAVMIVAAPPSPIGTFVANWFVSALVVSSGSTPVSGWIGHTITCQDVGIIPAGTTVIGISGSSVQISNQPADNNSHTWYVW